MRVRLHRVDLPLAHPFTIARGTRTVQRSLIVELEHDGVHGYGEATEHSYYGYTLDSISSSVNKCLPCIEAGDFSSADELWTKLRTILPSDTFALSAIDLAAHDLFGKIAGRRTYEMLGLQWTDIPKSSYTIGIDTIDRMAEKLEQRSEWPIFKIKLGTANDVEIIGRLRERTQATFRVDANCGWSAGETIEKSHALKTLGVEFIEQPLLAGASPADHRRVFDESALPIIADESCLVESDVSKCHGLFHGINIKLCKCGGLTPAVRMLREARGNRMKTMVGCMVESSVGISAAAQLLPLLDYADLDGAELLSGDAADGVAMVNGSAHLPATCFGNGVELLESVGAAN